MYMRDTMHQIDSGVVISFLKAILRKFRECVEIPLGLGSAAAKKLTNRLRKLLGKEKSASGHLLNGAHAYLVPVNYATANIFRQLQDKKKGGRHTRATDYRHLLLLLGSYHFFLKSPNYPKTTLPIIPKSSPKSFSIIPNIGGTIIVPPI
jgi:hypothetical protein